MAAPVVPPAEGTAAPPPLVAPRMMGMAYEKSTANLRILTQKRHEDRLEHHLDLQEMQALDIGMRESNDVDILKAKLRHKYGNLVLGWREGLDLRGAHVVSEVDWFKALRTLGFAGNASKAWSALAGGRKKVTLADLDPDSASLLSKFYQACVTEVSPVLSLMDGVEALRMTREVFLQRCANLSRKSHLRKYTIDVNGVFSRLCSQPQRVIVEDLEWLECYCTRKPRHTLKKAGESDSSEGDLAPTHAEAREMRRRREGLRDFKRQLSHRCGGIVQAWRKALDREGNDLISLEDLAQVVEAIEFEVPAKDLWEEIVGPEAEEMTLRDWCPQGAMAIKEFKKRCVDVYGSTGLAFADFKAKRKPLANKDEFRTFCAQIRLRSNHKMLFDYLDTRGVGYIQMAHIDMEGCTEAIDLKVISQAEQEYTVLEPAPRKQPHISVYRRAKEMCRASKRAEEPPSPLEELRTVLVKRWQSSVRAWARVLDPKGKGRLTKDEFIVGVSVAGYTGSTAALWDEMGLADDSHVRLRDIDPKVIEDCALFKSLSVKQLGRIITALEVDSGPNGKKTGCEIDLNAFAEVCKRIGYNGDPQALLLHFDPEGNGTVYSKNLRHFHEEKKDEKAIMSLLKRYHTQQNDKLRQHLDGSRIANTKEVTVLQDSIRKKGQQQWSEKIQPEKDRRLLISELSRGFGSVVRAWKRALNPSGYGELNFSQFVDGLKRAALAPPRPMEAEIQQFQKLFNYLLGSDPSATGLKLAHLDPKIEEYLQELKMRCCERYGSIWAAFDAFDPEGHGSITIDTLKHLCQEIKLTDGIHRLCHYFDPDGQGEVLLEEIDREAAEDAKDAAEERKEGPGFNQHSHSRRGDKSFLRVRESPEVIAMKKAQEDLTSKMRVKLKKRYQTIPKAWRTAFQAQSDICIEFEAFELGLAEAGIDLEGRDLWYALGCEMHDVAVAEKKRPRRYWIEAPQHMMTLLQMMDPAFEEPLADFEFRIKERWGSWLKAFKDLHAQGVDKLQLDEVAFRNMCHECQFRGNPGKLFDFFTANGSLVYFKTLNFEATEEFKEWLLAVVPNAQLPPDRQATPPKVGKAGLEDEEKGEGGDSDQDNPEDEAALESEEEEPPKLPEVPGLNRKDWATLFREHLERRFGNTLRAWRALDPRELAALKPAEFAKSYAATGFGAGPKVVWASLVGDGKYMTFRELDPEIFDLLMRFKASCVAVYETLEKVFLDKDIAKSGQLEEADFKKLCSRVAATLPAETLFAILVNNRGFVSAREVQFLNAFDEKNPRARPRRQSIDQSASGLGGSSLRSQFPPRTMGIGPLATSMRPRKVTLAKASSLPSLYQLPLRPNWNDRHYVMDQPGNRDLSVLHLLNHVNVEERERVRRRVVEKIRLVPTVQWLAEHLPQSEMQYDDDDD